jgi:hypothetical protein
MTNPQDSRCQALWPALKQEFAAAFRRAWRLWWGLWAAPFVGTWREVVRVVRIYLDG